MAMTSKKETQTLDIKFSLAHIGSFLSERNQWFYGELSGANWSPILNPFGDKINGSVSQEVLETISQFGLDSYLNNLGYVSHGEAIAHQRRSQVLLLIEIDSEDTKSIPGKLFEYMVSNRPIIGIGPKNSDFAEIITTTNTGCFLTIQRKWI
jgi:hypothetical protein